MTIYVDDISRYPSRIISNDAKKFGNRWCHMWTDGKIEDLHEFAKKIKLKKEWFQNNKRMPHYDLVESKRKLALENGAKYMSLKDWYRLKLKGCIIEKPIKG